VIFVNAHRILPSTYAHGLSWNFGLSSEPDDIPPEPLAHCQQQVHALMSYPDRVEFHIMVVSLVLDLLENLGVWQPSEVELG
jgi:hypothetical protein